MATTYDLHLDQGSTRRFYFICKTQTGVDIDNDPIYAPVDLTGCTARMQIRIAHGKPVIVEVNSTPTTDGALTVGTTDGRVDVWIADEGTDKVNIKKSRYDIEVTFPSGDVFRILEGVVTSSLSITTDP